MKSQRMWRAGEGVYMNQALDMWTFDPMTPAPWNGHGRCHHPTGVLRPRARLVSPQRQGQASLQRPLFGFCFRTTPR